jgi:hypothetical protein
LAEGLRMRIQQKRIIYRNKKIKLKSYR